MIGDSDDDNVWRDERIISHPLFLSSSKLSIFYVVRNIYKILKEILIS